MSITITQSHRLGGALLLVVTLSGGVTYPDRASGQTGPSSEKSSSDKSSETTSSSDKSSETKSPSDKSSKKDFSSRASYDGFQNLPEQKKRRFLNLLKEGKKTYQNGNFSHSKDLLKRAYDIFPDPRLKYRIGLCHERLDQPRQALEHYRAFLDEVPETPHRGKVQKSIELLKKEIETRRASIQIETEPPEAEVRIPKKKDGPLGTTPLEVSLDPGTYKMFIEREGFEKVIELIELEPKENRTINMTLERSAPSEEPSQPKSEEPDNRMKWGRIGAMSVGGLGLASAAVTGGLFFDAESTIETYRQNRDQHSRQSVDRAIKRSNTYRTLTWIGGGLAIAGLGTWTVLWVQSTHREASTSEGQQAARSDLEVRLVTSSERIGMRALFRF